MSDHIQNQCIERMEQLGLNPNQIAETLDGKVSRSHVCDYLTRRASMGSHKLQHVLTALSLKILPEESKIQQGHMTLPPFPQSLALILRPWMREKAKCQADVESALRSEAKIIRRHGTIAAYLEWTIGQHVINRTGKIAKQQNIRCRKLGIPGTISKLDVDEVFAATGNQCGRCGSNECLSVDHIVAIAQGGENLRVNLQALCRRCNSAKGGRPKKLKPAPSSA